MVLGAVLMSFLPQNVFAENKDLYSLVAENCGSIKTQIRRLQVSDANTRVALGQKYDYISGVLMNNMDLRVMANGQNADGLMKIANDFGKSVEYFRKSYTVYDNFATKILGVDCAQHPQEFYANLEELRLLRGGVKGNCNTLAELADKYRAEIVLRQKGPVENE
jgi:hypothetical protein